MKHSNIRRYRRIPAAPEAASFKKENQQEQSFFGDPVQQSFFKPAMVTPQQSIVNRKCDDCAKEDKVKEKEKVMKKEEEEEAVQAKTSEAASSGAAAKTSAYIGSINGKGQSMPKPVQTFFEGRMGAVFNDVKIHTGKEAEDSAKDINAQAYAFGKHIVFNEGKYQPDTAKGKQLLAHELAHVLQQDQKRVKRQPEEKSPETMDAKDDVTLQVEQLPPVFVAGVGTGTDNKIAFANCEGVSVQGHTVANYDHGSFSAASSSVTRAENCDGCEGDQCVTIVGSVTSVFQANPVVTLPSVPAGLNECEHTAVQTFIDGTLSQHEQQHVDAFNTYNGTVVTPFNFTGCREGLDAHVQAIHDRIEAARVISANAISDALDPFNPTIPCECPDPEPEAAPAPGEGTE